MKIWLTLFLLVIPGAWGSALPPECEELLSEAGVVARWTAIQKSPEWVQRSLNPLGWHEHYAFSSTTIHGRAPTFALAQAIAFQAREKFHNTRKPQLNRELQLKHLESGEFRNRITQHLISRPTLLCGILGGEIGAVCSLAATVSGTVSIPVGLTLGTLSMGFTLLAAWQASSEVIRRDYFHLPERSSEAVAGASWRVREALLSGERSPMIERFFFSASGHFLFVEAVVPEDQEKEVQMELFWASPSGG